MKKDDRWECERCGLKWFPFEEECYFCDVMMKDETKV